MQKWERLNELETEQEKLKKEYRKSIGDSTNRMGGNVFSSAKEKKDMEKAYNKLMDMKEQEIENNAVKIKELRKEVYKTTKDSGLSDEDKKLARDDEFRQMKFRKGGVVYANCGASVKPAQKAKK
jgi:Mor family transcriptional regulator